MTRTYPIATLVITDIQGSSRLWERLGGAFSPVLAAHNRIVREAIAAAGGIELETEGDSFTVAFEEATPAVRFALAVQTALHAHAWPADAGEIRVRIGVASGEAPRGEDRKLGRLALSGPLSARVRLVSTAAHGGQVIVADSSWALAGSIENAAVTDLGEHRLGPADRPERLWQVLPAALSSRTFPPPRTQSSRPTNISPVPGRFFGRERELNELSALLPSPAGRLVTLTGIGGIGKTRLARQVALRCLPAFEGGCWLADLLEARTATDIARSVAEALGVQVQGNESPENAVADALAFRKPLLLVLDGFEALVEHAPATIGLWMRRARHVRFLITSLSLVGLTGEREFAVPPLSIPDRQAAMTPEITRFDAVRLFVDRAAAVSEDFTLDAASAPAIGRLCADLEGIPLAIELAAARVTELSPEQMMRDLEHQLETRGESPSGVPHRQKSMTGALEWSYGLLSDWQRSAFHQACIFRGGFMLAAAEDIIDLGDFDDAPHAIDAVQALRDQSLLRTLDTPFGTRFTIFRSMREFGEKRWRDSTGADERKALEDRHARHYVTFVEWWSALFPSAQVREALDWIESERENVFAVLDRLLARPDAASKNLAARAMLAVDPPLRWRGPVDERSRRFLSCLAAPPPDPVLLARLQTAASDAQFWSVLPGAVATGQAAVATADATGDPDLRTLARLALARAVTGLEPLSQTIALLESAVEIARPGKKPGTLAMALVDLALLLMRAGQHERARDLVVESLAIARKAGDPTLLVRALTGHNVYLRSVGQSREGILLLDEAEVILEDLHSPSNLAKLRGNRGLCLSDLGRFQEAHDAISQTVAAQRDMGMKRSVAVNLLNLGIATYGLGRHEEALEVLREAESLGRSVGDIDIATRAVGSRGAQLLEVGKFEEALPSCRQAAEEFRRSGNRESFAIHSATTAQCLWELGRPEEAHAFALESLETWRTLPRVAHSAFAIAGRLALHEQAAGRTAEARAFASESLEFMKQTEALGGKFSDGSRQLAEKVRAVLG